MLNDISTSTIETASRYHCYRIKNRNTASLSLYTDGHVIAAQPTGKQGKTYTSIYVLILINSWSKIILFNSL